jgi:YD repeat-containing protein
MKSVPASVVAAVLVSLVACDRPDAKPGVRLVSTSPAHGATKVGVHDPIVLTFSGPLDPASITPNTVKLRRSGETESPNPKLTYDPNTYSVTIAPRDPIDWGERQDVIVMGLKDPFGDSVLRTKVSFWTWRNPSTDLIKYDATGAVQFRLEFVNDDEGRQVREIGYLQGIEGVWFWRGSAYDDRGNLTRRATHSGPGYDGEWFTEDDVVDDFETYEYDELGNLTRYTRYSGAGQMIDYGTIVYDQLGNATHGSAGQGSAEGAEAYWWLSTHDVFGNQTGYYEASSLGSDGTLGTADDSSPVAWTTEWDGGGTLLAHARGIDPGDDALWLTADDVEGERYVYTYDASGNRVRYDAGSSCQELHYDGAGKVVREMWYGAGTDDRCFEGVDVLWYQTDFGYDDAGRRTLAVNYVLGVESGYTSTSYAANGNRTRVVRHDDGTLSYDVQFDPDR